MKHLKLSIAWLAMIALTLTSCSKDESGTDIQDQEKIQLTFGSLLSDMNSSLNKQATPGECREGDPAYVHVGVTDDDGNYIGMGGGTPAVNLIEVDLKWNSAMNVYETTYSAELGLPAGDYQLEHFIVYSETDEVLWVAPRVEGSFDDYVDNPLPQPIELIAGTKPYITVDVLCYEARNEEAYGYIFFDINLNRVENSYCIFVNYCPGENGREVPAHFMIEVWTDGFGGDDEVVLSNDRNSVNTDGAWPAASVLCIAVPDIGDGTFYARVSILDHDYYDSDPTINFVEFTFTQDDIDAQRLMVPAYEHIRYGCQPPAGEPNCPEDGYPLGDQNQDCVVDCRDTNTCPNEACPGVDPVLDVNGDCIIDCLDTNTCGGETPGCDDTAYAFGGVELDDLGYSGNNWGWGIVIGDDEDDFNEGMYWVDDHYEFPFIAGAGQNDVDKGWEAGIIIVTIENGWFNVEIDLHDDVTMTESHIWFSEMVGDGQWPSSRAPGQFDLDDYSFELDGDGPYTLIVHSGGVTHESCDLD